MLESFFLREVFKLDVICLKPPSLRQPSFDNLQGLIDTEFKFENRESVWLLIFNNSESIFLPLVELIDPLSGLAFLYNGCATIFDAYNKDDGKVAEDVGSCYTNECPSS